MQRLLGLSLLFLLRCCSPSIQAASSHADFSSPYTNTMIALDDMRQNASSGSSAMYHARRKEGSSVVEYSWQQNLNEEHNKEVATRVCHLTILQPSTSGNNQPAGDFSFSSELAAYIAALHFNERNDVIVKDLRTNPYMKDCNVQFTTEFQDTQYSPIGATRILVDDILTRRPSTSVNNTANSFSFGPESNSTETDILPIPCAILGSTRSAVTAPLALLSSLYDIPTISAASTSSQLDRSDIYGLFARTIPTDAGVAHTAVDYLRSVKNVTHLGVLYFKDEFGTDYFREFTRAALNLDPPMVLVSAAYIHDEASLHQAFATLAQSEFNYFFGITTSRTQQLVLRVGMDQGVFGPGKFWLFGEGASLLLNDDFGYAKEEVDMIQATNGVEVIWLDVPQNEAMDEEWSRVQGDDAAMRYFFSKQPPNINLTNHMMDPTSGFWDYLQYDAVMALGLAACSARADFFSGPMLHYSLKRMSFEGASGSVSFDARTGTRDFRRLSYRVRNVVARQEEDGFVAFDTPIVARQYPKHHRPVQGGHTPTWDAAPQGIMQWRTLQRTTYAGGTYKPPPILVPLSSDAIEHHFLSFPVRVAGWALAGILAVTSITFAVWTCSKRHVDVVKCSQPIFLILLCAGAFVMTTSIIPLSLQEPVSQKGLSVACRAAPWLFQTGFVICFSALVSKAARMKKLVEVVEVTRGFKRIRVNTFKVVLPLIILFTFNILLLSMWTILAPLEWKRTALSTDTLGRTLETYGHCVTAVPASAERPPIPPKFFLLFFGVIDVTLLFLAIMENVWSARAGTPSQYREETYVKISMICILQSFIIGMPVLVAVRTNPTATFLTQAAFVSVIVSSVLLPLFLPKMDAWRKGTKGCVEDRFVVTAVSDPQETQNSRRTSIGERRSVPKRPVTLQPTWSAIVREERGEIDRDSSTREMDDWHIYQVIDPLSDDSEITFNEQGAAWNPMGAGLDALAL